MCVAVPGQVIERADERAVVDFQGTRLAVNLTLTPEVGVGDWVLVHAGFALSSISADEARETWSYLQAVMEPTGAKPEPGRGTP